MLKSQAFKTSFIATIIFFIMILLFFIIDFNTKASNFKDAPSILKIENINREHYDIEIIGQKYEIKPLKININPKYIPIIRALIPQKLKLLESFIYYTYATYNDIIKYYKNIDYLKSIKF